VYNRKPILSDPFLNVEWPFFDSGKEGRKYVD
jgi:hypothetical protein